jgi:hypothetical protein
MCLGKFSIIVLALTLTVSPLVAASYSPKSSRADADATHKKSIPGAEIFDNKHVLALQIAISPADWRTLQQDDRNRNRPDVHVTVREGAMVWKDVALHLKGRGLEVFRASNRNQG